jgi:hypothetical protein
MDYQQLLQHKLTYEQSNQNNVCPFVCLQFVMYNY